VRSASFLTIFSRCAFILKGVRMKHEESLSQIALLEWFKLRYPTLGGLLVGYPAGVYLGITQRVRMKAMGLTPGFPDLMLLVPKVFEIYHPGSPPKRERHFIPGMFIEMKSAKGKLSKVQKEYHEKLRVWNYTIVIAYSFEEAQEEIKKYLE
jgi:hypothetical protein